MFPESSEILKGFNNKIKSLSLAYYFDTFTIGFCGFVSLKAAKNIISQPNGLLCKPDDNLLKMNCFNIDKFGKSTLYLGIVISCASYYAQ